jgi:prevent-host-death family protein
MSASASTGYQNAHAADALPPECSRSKFRDQLSSGAAGAETPLNGHEARGGRRPYMKQIPVSQFKANCSALVEQVRKTKRSIQITRRGKVIAEVRPVEKSANWLGSMKGTVEILGDIVSPVIDLEDIEALKGLAITGKLPHIKRMVTPVP